MILDINATNLSEKIEPVFELFSISFFPVFNKSFYNISMENLKNRFIIVTKVLNS